LSELLSSYLVGHFLGKHLGDGSEEIQIDFEEELLDQDLGVLELAHRRVGHDALHHAALDERLEGGGIRHALGRRNWRQHNWEYWIYELVVHLYTVDFHMQLVLEWRRLAGYPNSWIKAAS